MSKFNHAFTLGFEVVSKAKDGSDITPKQFARAIRARVKDLLANNEMWEAVGAPYDTFQYGGE